MQNIEAAEVLIVEHMYASSIHCSYYGCFQRIKYTLKTYVPFPSYEDLEVSVKLKGVDSHRQLFKYLLKKYRVKGKTGTDVLRLVTQFNDIKLARKKSDYSDFEITPTYSTNTLTISKHIIEELINTFGS